MNWFAFHCHNRLTTSNRLVCISSCNVVRWIFLYTKKHLKIIHTLINILLLVNIMNFIESWWNSRMSRAEKSRTTSRGRHISIWILSRRWITDVSGPSARRSSMLKDTEPPTDHKAIDNLNATCSKCSMASVLECTFMLQSGQPVGLINMIMVMIKINHRPQLLLVHRPIGSFDSCANLALPISKHRLRVKTAFLTRCPSDRQKSRRCKTKKKLNRRFTGV